MLALKLLLVPGFLLLVSMAGKRWGASVAGWLAGLPAVAGPILFFLAMAHGTGFASNAAAAALSAVLASVSFSLAYAHAAQHQPWPWSLLVALAAWALAAAGLSALPTSALRALAVSLLTLVLAPRLFPAVQARPADRCVNQVELVCRMLTGALLTLTVTWLAGRVGHAWSGLLAVFPILGIVLAVFSHRTQGAAYAALLLRAMATGLYSFVAFCFVLSITLPALGLVPSFALATAASLLVQAGTRSRLASAKKQAA